MLPDPLAHTVVEGTTAGMGNLEVVMEFGADEDDDGGLRDEDEGFLVPWGGVRAWHVLR